LSATLPSNNGDARLEIRLGKSSEYAHDPGFESSVNLHGLHWDGDHTFPFSASVEGIWLRTADLMELHNHISHWTGKPLDRLAVEDLESDFELARLPGQRVRISLGSRPDTVSDRNPVVSISFSSGAFRGEFHFVTDQSCLGLFTQELYVELARSRQNAV
jgi:hypothetical protein